MRVVFGECEFDSGRRVLIRARAGHAAFPQSLPAPRVASRSATGGGRQEGAARSPVAGDVRLRCQPPQPDGGGSSRRRRYAEDGALHPDRPAVRLCLSRRCATGLGRHQFRPGPSGARLVLGSREWLLSEGSNLVGRDRDCPVRIDSTTVSRQHVRIELTNNGATAEDLGSKNGTLVNGQRVATQIALKDGDQIQIGSVTLTYRIPDGLPSTVTRLA